MSPAYPRELGRAFEDDEVARNYRYRRPYPPEVFEILKGLLVEPQNVVLLQNLGDLLAERHDREGARQIFERLIRLDPDNPLYRQKLDGLR